MFNNYRYKCFNKRVAKHAVAHVRSRSVQSFKTAKVVGIVVLASNEKCLDEVLEIKRNIENFGIRVSSLIYYPNKEIPNSFLMRKDVDIVNCKSLNWLDIPESPIVDTFLKKNFDMLIDLSREEILPVRWISSISKAEFKIGIKNYFRNPFDLIVSVGPNDSYMNVFNSIISVVQTISGK